MSAARPGQTVPQDLEARMREAWLEARQGDPVRAFRLSQDLSQNAGVERSRLPLFHAGLLLAFRDHLNAQNQDAAEKFYRLMFWHPEEPMPRQIFLGMLQLEVMRRLAQAPGTPPMRGRLVFGLGSGRSGSTTLSALFAAQAQTCWSHEHPPMVAWGKEGRGEVDFHLTRMNLLAHVYSVVADVSHWWLPKLPALLQNDPRTRFVVIRRDRAATVASFMRMKGLDQPKGLNHWMAHDGVRFRRNPWDRCYPKFQVDDPEEAIGLYWDRYYAMSEDAARRHPEQVRMFEIEVLTDPAGQREILEFCGYESPVLVPGLHRNQGSAADGMFHWCNPFPTDPVPSAGYHPQRSHA
jgi:hypothetical protein